MRLEVKCICGREISKSDAAKVMRSGRKEITSEQAKAMVAAREAKRNKK